MSPLRKQSRIEHDKKLDSIYPANFCGWVEVEKEPGKGEFDREFLLNASGSCHNPEKEKAMVAKYRALLEGIVPTEQRASVEAAIMDIESTDAKYLVNLMSCHLREAARVI